MGNNCSGCMNNGSLCNNETLSTKTKLASETRPTEFTHNFGQTAFTEKNEEEEPPSAKKVSKFQLPKDKFTSKISTPTDSPEFSFKKVLTFLRGTSDVRSEFESMEFLNPISGENWVPQNIILHTMLRKSDTIFLWKGKNTELDKECAVKIILTQDRADFLVRTLEVLRRLSSQPGKCRLEIYAIAVWEVVYESKNCYALIILEEWGGGNLQEYIRYKTSRKDYWTEKQLINLTNDIYSGLCETARLGIAHNDIKPENVFLSTKRNMVLLSDFKGITAYEKENGNVGSKMLLQARSTKDVDMHGLPIKQDVKYLARMILSIVVPFEEVKEIERYINNPNETSVKYPNLMEFLRLLIEGVEIRIDEFLEQNNVENFKFAHNAPPSKMTVVGPKKPEDSERTTEKWNKLNDLSNKIDSYELMRNYQKGHELAMNQLKEFEHDRHKSDHDYQLAIRWIIKVLKHYGDIKGNKNGSELIKELRPIIKDKQFKQFLKRNMNELISFTFNLANIYNLADMTDKALKLYQRGITLCQGKKFSSIENIDAHYEVGKLYVEKKRAPKALEYAKKYVEYVDGLDHQIVKKFKGYQLLAEVHKILKEPGDALKYYAKANEYLNRFGTYHVDESLKILDEIAGLYRELKDFDNASRVYEDSIKSRKLMEDQNQEKFAEIYKSLADIYLSVQKFDLAKVNYECYLEILKKKKVKDTIYDQTVTTLGEIYFKVNELQKAFELYTEYREIKNAELGEDSPVVVEIQNKLACIAFLKNRIVDSLNIQLKVLPIKQKIYKDRKDKYMISLNNLGDTYFALKNYKEALKYHTECMKCIEMDFWPPEYSQILINIAMDNEKLGNKSASMRNIYEGMQASGNSGLLLNLGHTIEVFENMAVVNGNQVKGLNFEKIMRVSE